MCILIVSVTPGNYVGDPGVCYSGPNLLLVTIIASTCAGLSHTAGSGDPRVCNMYVCATLLVLWGSLQGSRATCTTAYGDKIRYCKNFQTDYIEGIEILIFEERDVGRINSTVFSSPNLKSVLSLTLKGSKIHTVESGAFQEFRGLGNIELQDNSLSSLSPAWFHDPTTLRNLTVASNRIGQLRPGMLEGFSNLERLNLSRNLITSVHSESFWGLSKMASLDLSYNKISSLRRQTLSPLNGTSVRLGGNPWNCSCAHKDFILFLKELMNTSRLADPSSVTCHYPADMIGVLVWNVSEMNCSVAALPPPSQAVFQKVVLPVLFVVLALFVFILLILLLWKKKQDQKQVQPDKRGKGEAAPRLARRSPPVFGDVVFMNQNLRGIRTVSTGQNPLALGRAKSAAAILLQAEFSPSNGKQRGDSKKMERDKILIDGRNLKENSEGNMETWYYNALQGKVRPVPSSNMDSCTMEDTSTRTSVVTSDDPSRRSATNTDEPLVYLCMNTTREDSTVTTIPIQKTPSKPRIMRRTMSWPNVMYKKEPRTSYEDFLKTLNVSPRPGGSYKAQEKCKTYHRPDRGGHPEAIQVSRKSRGSPGKMEIKDLALGDPTQSKVTERLSRNATRNIYQRSGNSRRVPRSKGATPETGAKREGSELRRTPDDEQLLENNEYNFIDLLHEVVENHGRWTRERWRQSHQQRMSSKTSPHP